MTNAHGIACWDNTRGSEACGSPSQNVIAAGAEFLVSDAPAGALVMKSGNERTCFSVNGRIATFQDNQGFYEFDVEIK